MTRTERLAAHESRAKARLDDERKKYATAQREVRADAKRTRVKRYYLLGKLLDEAGLLALTDADLAALVHLLAPLAQVPNPVAVLEALLTTDWDATVDTLTLAVAGSD